MHIFDLPYMIRTFNNIFVNKPSNVRSSFYDDTNKQIVFRYIQQRAPVIFLLYPKDGFQDY